MLGSKAIADQMFPEISLGRLLHMLQLDQRRLDLTRRTYLADNAAVSPESLREQCLFHHES